MLSYDSYWEEDSCLCEITLIGVARALKSFLEQMYQTTLALVFLIHNIMSASFITSKDYDYVTVKHKLKRKQLEGI